MIKHISFKHGWFYHYRIHEIKTKNLCQPNFFTLSDYLYEMFSNCPNDYFNKGPRSSSLKLNVNTDLINHKSHDVCVLAKQGLSINMYKTAHSNVQLFMLNYDKDTIGIEVPIWLMPNEIEEFNLYFNEDLPLSGHIDVLQIKENKIWIWDYKPKAHLEKFASTQTYFYALMLSKRTGIPIDNFMCGYFDDIQAFIFNPSKTKVTPSSISSIPLLFNR